MIDEANEKLEEIKHEVMKRGPRNPNTDGLMDDRLLFLSCGQMGLIQAAAGFFTYFVVMAENGFWPKKLLGLRKEWDRFRSNIRRILTCVSSRIL